MSQAASLGFVASVLAEIAAPTPLDPSIAEAGVRANIAINRPAFAEVERILIRLRLEQQVEAQRKQQGALIKRGRRRVR